MIVPVTTEQFSRSVRAAQIREVLPIADFASDWPRYPVREIYPFTPTLAGLQITETEFRRLVKALHAIR